MEKSNDTIVRQKRLIRLPEVLSRTGYGRTTIYRKMEDGSFPRSVKLGGPLEAPNAFDCRAVAWIEDEVEQWIESRIDERDSSLIDIPTEENIVR